MSIDGKEVVIIVRGGMVQGVYADDSDLRVKVVDFDNNEGATDDEKAEYFGDLPCVKDEYGDYDLDESQCPKHIVW